MLHGEGAYEVLGSSRLRGVGFSLFSHLHALRC